MRRNSDPVMEHRGTDPIPQGGATPTAAVAA